MKINVFSMKITKEASTNVYLFIANNPSQSKTSVYNDKNQTQSLT